VGLNLHNQNTTKIKLWQTDEEEKKEGGESNQWGHQEGVEAEFLLAPQEGPRQVQLVLNYPSQLAAR